MHSYPEFPILIVDDDSNICFSMSSVLRAEGISNVLECQKSVQTLDVIKESGAQIVLLDLVMPGKSGEELLPAIKDEFPDVVVIIVTGKDGLQTALNCMRNGAYDYISKPVDENLLIPSLRRAIKMQELKAENEKLTKHILEKSISNPAAFASIITRSDRMKNLFSYCEAISHSSQPILITGETGTGKELFAKAIHTLSGRNGKFIAVNVSGLESTIFSDTLFGHVKGAFTGAAGIRKGLVEEAKGGVLFLDEIGDLDEHSQVKILRLLQEREYSPLGSDASKLTDAKIIVATLKDLRENVTKGLFRKDLYYRLQTHHIKIPPLRERKEDIQLLLNHFLEEACLEMDKKIPAYPHELIQHLSNYDFPGNVRELRSMVFDAITGYVSKMLSLESFRLNIENAQAYTEFIETPGDNIYGSLTKLPTLKSSSQMLVAEAMRRSGGNQSAACVILGITQQALSLRLKTGK
ncbi:MAG: hypothetical protein A2020_11725 [Lentisphaerae bacterium GWF2_45_14]|nr:MAG: hypothetical protein A2020_11725 [Lentisphaerae bacterium GWF2_45_14]